MERIVKNLIFLKNLFRIVTKYFPKRQRDVYGEEKNYLFSISLGDFLLIEILVDRMKEVLSFRSSFYFRCMKRALSPLDGRYETILHPLRKYFSEEALMYYRVLVEVRWFCFLSKREDIQPFRTLHKGEEEFLEHILKNFSECDEKRIKEIEITTNHDVKAVEYFLKEKIKNTDLQELSEWIHFSLTSEDVNNLAYALLIKDSIENIILPELISLEGSITSCAKSWKDIPMLSRTHGQPASPTTLGKEFLIYVHRINRQVQHLKRQDYLGKIAGASGNFNAHMVAFPKANWLEISEQFVVSLGLTWNPVVPQIEPHDFLAEISHIFMRINTIGVDFSRDSWGYISLNFFSQKVKKNEVGSSAMPHKVNPIDFENAEGNFGVSSALFSHFSEKLPISRWQRDLSDSTVLRNMGIGIGHHYLALKSLKKGIQKLQVQKEIILDDLQKHPEVLAEAIQTVMRSQGISNSYELLKEITRGKQCTLQDFQEFAKTLNVPEVQKKALLSLLPETYTGLSGKICEIF
jgi:adenylosuccinate lyase